MKNGRQVFIHHVMKLSTLTLQNTMQKCCCYDRREQYLDAHAETTGNCKAMSEIVDHVG